MSEKEVDEVTDAITKQVVAMTLQGAAPYRISQELKITRRAVSKLQKSKRFRELVREVGDDALELAKSYVRNKISDLAPKAITALSEELGESGKSRIEAVKIVLRGIGALDNEENKGQDTSIQVIFPTSKEGTTIDVTQQSRAENIEEIKTEI